MPTADPAIQLDRVSRHYTMGETSVRAVNELSLSVANNEFLALLGSSGSGKSTLLNLIAGLDRPSSGSIFAHGQNIASLSSLALACYRRNTIGMIFQSFNLLPRMTLEEKTAQITTVWNRKQEILTPAGDFDAASMEKKLRDAFTASEQVK